MQFGCNKSSYDSRDYKLNAQVVNNTKLPTEYVIPIKVNVKNQKSVWSCVAHAASSILEHHAKANETLSTNFIYGIQKKLFNHKVRGMTLRDACKIMADYGDMLESDCSGNTEVPNCFSIAEDAFDDDAKLQKASEYRISKYFLCLNNQHIKYALYKYGPVLAAMRWYDTYKVDKTGKLTGEKKGLGYGHAIMIYGYNEKGFLCQNSWGTYWGNGGRFILPYSIKLQEARGIVDWNGTTELKTPKTGTVANTAYKAWNAWVNTVAKVIYK